MGIFFKFQEDYCEKNLKEEDVGALYTLLELSDNLRITSREKMGLGKIGKFFSYLFCKRAEQFSSVIHGLYGNFVEDRVPER